MMRIFLLMTMAFSLYASSPTYAVKYKGTTLGEIHDLSTLESLYLKAEVTSRIARFLLGKEYLVFYGDAKPEIKGAKYKRDKKMMLYAFSQSLSERPKFKRYPINEIKNITLRCEGEMCEFIYYKNERVDGKGKISFDANGSFVSLTEEFTDFEIVKK